MAEYNFTVSFAKKIEGTVARKYESDETDADVRLSWHGVLEIDKPDAPARISFSSADAAVYGTRTLTITPELRTAVPDGTESVMWTCRPTRCRVGSTCDWRIVTKGTALAGLRCVVVFKIECHTVDFDEVAEERRIREMFETEKVTMFGAMAKLLEGGICSDVTILHENVPYKLHRAILVVRSQYFRGLLAGAFSESAVPSSAAVPVQCPCSPRVFRQLLFFLYCNHVQEWPRTAEDCLELWTAADYLGIDCLALLSRRLLKFYADEDHIYALLTQRPVLGGLEQFCFQRTG